MPGPLPDESRCRRPRRPVPSRPPPGHREEAPVPQRAAARPTPTPRAAWQARAREEARVPAARTPPPTPANRGRSEAPAASLARARGCWVSAALSPECGALRRSGNRDGSPLGCSPPRSPAPRTRRAATGSVRATGVTAAALPQPGTSRDGQAYAAWRARCGLILSGPASRVKMKRRGLAYVTCLSPKIGVDQALASFGPRKSTRASFEP